MKKEQNFIPDNCEQNEPIDRVSPVVGELRLSSSPLERIEFVREVERLAQHNAEQINLHEIKLAKELLVVGISIAAISVLFKGSAIVPLTNFVSGVCIVGAAAKLIPEIIRSHVSNSDKSGGQANSPDNDFKEKK